MTGTLVMCADDFGRSPAINDAVLVLAQRRVLTAATVMVDEPWAAEAAPDLLGINGFHIGLHLTLTDAPVPKASAGFVSGGVLPSIDRLTLDAYRGELPLPMLEAEVARQFDMFERIFGKLPDFVDAHQHAHLLPGIRRTVLDETARRDRRIWVRSCEDRLGAITQRGGDRLRAWRSAFLSRGLRRDAAERGLVTNDGFAGLYDLQSPGHYADRFPAFLRRPALRNHLVIVHPATRAEAGDSIGPSRIDEYRYLLDAPVAEMAARHGLAVGAFQ